MPMRPHNSKPHHNAVLRYAESRGAHSSRKAFQKQAAPGIPRREVTMIDIEERKRAQQELQQLVDAVPQHIVSLYGDGKVGHYLTRA